MKQLVELQSLIPRNHQSDTVVVAVSPDPINKCQESIRTVTSRSGKPLMLTVVSDSAHKVIDAYGLRNDEEEANGLFLPHPTTYVIDPTGKVRWRFTEKNQAVRPSNQSIIEQASKVW